MRTPPWCATDGDNTNIVIGQVLQKRYGIETVVVRVLDPARAKLYSDRGMSIVCPTQTAISSLLDTVRASVARGTIGLTCTSSSPVVARSART